MSKRYKTVREREMPKMLQRMHDELNDVMEYIQVDMLKTGYITNNKNSVARNKKIIEEYKELQNSKFTVFDPDDIKQKIKNSEKTIVESEKVIERDEKLIEKLKKYSLRFKEERDIINSFFKPLKPLQDEDDVTEEEHDIVVSFPPPSTSRPAPDYAADATRGGKS